MEEQVFFGDDLRPLKDDATGRLCTGLLRGEWLEHRAPAGERTLVLCVQPAQIRTEMRPRRSSVADLLADPKPLEDLDEVVRNMPGGDRGGNGPGDE